MERIKNIVSRKRDTSGLEQGHMFAVSDLDTGEGLDMDGIYSSSSDEFTKDVDYVFPQKD